MWNLKVKGTDVVAYNQRFQELALLCDRMFPEETDKIERYVGGMADLIYSSVCGIEAKNLAEAIEMALNKIRELSLLLKTAETREQEAWPPGQGRRTGLQLRINNNNNRNNNNNNNRNNNNNNNRNNNNPEPKGKLPMSSLLCLECEAPATSKRSPWKNRTGNWQRCSHLCSGQQPCIPPIRDDWDRLFQPMFDEYFNPLTIFISPVQEDAALRAEVLADSPVSISIDQDAPSTSIPTSQE
ncbi:hypothetical protein Tco_1575327 [Tanacetum coccineum]